MKALPIQIRNKVYKAILHQIQNDFPNLRICEYIVVMDHSSFKDIKIKFPDFWKYKPTNKRGYEPWFDSRRRIEVLKELIKATNNY